MINRINNKLKELNSGNYLIQIQKLNEIRDSKYASYEYYRDCIIHIIDTTNTKREIGLNVPGLGPKPIELNKNRTLHHSMYFRFNDFEEELTERCIRWQLTINNEGRYVQDRK